MKKNYSKGTLIFLILSMACSISNIPWPENVNQITHEAIDPARETIIQEQQQAVLLFSIGVHVEPFGAQVSSLVEGASQPIKTPQQSNYHNRPLYERHAQNLRDLASVVEGHAGVLTVQVQSPFTRISIATGNTVLADLVADGHEMALHFHEDAHLGKNSNQLDAALWCAVLQEELALINQASAVANIRYWSGGNLYPHLLEAASCAGLDVNSDWKNPQTQTTNPALVAVNPWRPAGSSQGADVSLFAQHNPEGEVVFLPDGVFDRDRLLALRQSDNFSDEDYFEYLRASLYASLNAAGSEKVNVFHLTVHAGELVGDPENTFELLNTWLTKVIDPLVVDGRVQWATFSEMADAFADWERQHPGEDARAETIHWNEVMMLKRDLPGIG